MFIKAQARNILLTTLNVRILLVFFYYYYAYYFTLKIGENEFLRNARLFPTYAAWKLRGIYSSDSSSCEPQTQNGQKKMSAGNLLDSNLSPVCWNFAGSLPGTSRPGYKGSSIKQCQFFASDGDSIAHSRYDISSKNRCIQNRWSPMYPATDIN
jgi:hypothetical protein